MLLKYPRGSGSGERVGEQEHKKWEQSRELKNKLQIGRARVQAREGEGGRLPYERGGGACHLA